jgi:ABC-type lipoprotein export system ATPase subunit
MFGRGARSNGKPTHNGATSSCIIYAHDVVKTYHTGTEHIRALNSVNFAVERGEMVAIMGPSGCGKTTLLNCLSGLDNVDSGQIWLEGKNLATLSDRARTTYRAQRMGFIFQVYNLLPVLNAIENVELPLLVSGLSPKDARTRSMAALERVGLAAWATHRPAELSGGQRQRVTIARSLVNNPALVWADEPTGALDSSTAHEIMGLLKDLNKRDGLSCVLVTHDAAIGEQCDRIVKMRDGLVVDQPVPSCTVEYEVVVPQPRRELAGVA